MHDTHERVLLLVVFAFVAGAGTALSPCVLPVLPALLSAGATGGRRRPLGIVLGLTVTFTVTIVGLATVVDGVGLGSSLVRDLAIVALAGFGLAVIFPPAHCAAVPIGALRTAQLRPRVLVGVGRRRRARLPVRAVCRARAGGRGRGQRGLRPHRRRGPRVRARVGGGAVGAGVVRPPCDAARARARIEPHARRRDGADGGGDGVPARHPLPDRDRRRAPRRAGESHPRPGDLRGGR